MNNQNTGPGNEDKPKEVSEESIRAAEEITALNDKLDADQAFSERLGQELEKDPVEALKGVGLSEAAIEPFLREIGFPEERIPKADVTGQSHGYTWIRYTWCWSIYGTLVRCRKVYYCSYGYCTYLYSL